MPVDDTLINPQGVDIPPSKLFRGASSLGLGGYVDLGIDVTRALKLVPSLRLDCVPDRRPDARLGRSAAGRALRASTPEVTAKAYLGEFSQPPQPEAVDARFGNPNVGIEHATHVGLGYEWKPDRLWSIDSEIYYVRRRNLVVFIERDPDERRRHVPERQLPQRGPPRLVRPRDADQARDQRARVRLAVVHVQPLAPAATRRRHRSSRPRSTSRTCSTRSRAGSRARAGSSARGSSSRAGGPTRR